MKPIDKKEMPKLIALCVMAVGLLGYVVLQVLAASGSAAASGKANDPAAAAAAATAASASAGAAEAAAAAANAAASLEGVGINMLTTGRDPFVPNGPVASFMPGGGPVVTPRPASPAASAVAGPGIRPVSPAAQRLDKILGMPASYPRPGLPTGGWAELRGENAGAAGPDSTGGAAAAAAVKAVPLPPPPPPAYTVTGVILGNSDDAQDVAILRGGSGSGGAGEGSERRFVIVGDPVGNGFVVASISRTGVELKSGARRFTLKIGKSGEESRAN